MRICNLHSRKFKLNVQRKALQSPASTLLMVISPLITHQLTSNKYPSKLKVYSTKYHQPTFTTNRKQCFTLPMACNNPLYNTLSLLKTENSKKEVRLTVFGPIPLNCDSSLFTSSTDNSRRYSRQILPFRSLTPLSIARILAAFVAANPPHRMASSNLVPSSSTTSRTNRGRTKRHSVSGGCRTFFAKGCLSTDR